MDVATAAAYLCVGPQTVRDWIVDKLLEPVRMPGSTIRNKKGQIITPASAHRIGKLLLDRNDLDRLIDQRKKDL